MPTYDEMTGIKPLPAHIKFTTEREILERTQVNRKVLERWVEVGFFPAPIILPDGKRRIKRWKIGEVEIWFADPLRWRDRQEQKTKE